MEGQAGGLARAVPWAGALFAVLGQGLEQELLRRSDDGRGQHTIHQMGGAVRGASGPTGGTQPAGAAEPEQPLVPARGAAHASAAMSRHATGQKASELTLEVTRIRRGALAGGQTLTSKMSFLLEHKNHQVRHFGAGLDQAHSQNGIAFFDHELDSTLLIVALELRPSVFLD